MEAYKCDRCFNYFTDKSELVVNTANSSYRSIKIKAGVLSTSYLDLCPKCQNSLKHWLQNPVIDEGRE